MAAWTLRRFLVFAATALVLLLPVMLPVTGAFAKTCFRGRPLPECRSFWITEMGAAIDYNDSDTQYVTLELGHMVNLTRRFALGGTVLNGYTGSGARFGLKARGRVWITPRLSVDVSPGAIVHDERYSENAAEFTGHVGLNYGDWFAAVGQLETDHVGHEDAAPRRTISYVGLKAGSYPGLVTFGLTAIWVGILTIAFRGDD